MIRRGRAEIFGAIVCVLLAGCGTSAGEQTAASEQENAVQEETEQALEERQEELQDSQEESREESQAMEDKIYSVWQEAYVDYLASAPDREEASAGGYVLIYVDDDDIPELVDIGDCEAEGTRLISFTEGKLQKTQLSRLYFSYLEREGLLCNSDGNMDCYWDLIYQVQDGRVTELAEGYYGLWQYYEEDRETEFDEEGMPIYLYEWNKEKVTEEEYMKALYEVYDLERAVPGFSYENGRDGYTAGEMTKILENWEG